MSALLEVDGLSVQLPVAGEFRTVLQDVSFSLEAGQTLGLVGESGSGKSMTVRSIARLLPPGARTTGSIRFDGASVLDLRGDALRKFRSRDVSMIFQDPRAHTNPVRKIGDFLTEAMRINGKVPPREAERRAVELLAEVGIHDGERRLKQFPHELSGGLLQRVMIAASLAVKPRLILADEPTTALDVTTQSEVMAILARLQREYGMAMLFITHDLELAAAVCDRTVVMYAGAMVEHQDSSRLHTDPLHPYSAALMQARPEIDRRVPRLPAIPGHPTSAFEAPDGCAFAPRCRFAEDACRAALPPLESMGDAAYSRCRRAAELRGHLLATAEHSGGLGDGAGVGDSAGLEEEVAR
ncbi:ABC transporter ATP-binding protein [Arthrobacter sp. AZCC_0090]|uniref:ABC transporter ATP-binding protein n=1 Tax=Arthrobacter sp. AZCC_0090 TaxID=2735881 RepID=UPI001620E822|nr:ABC transporter ATP-binding protein [Arthrobacter sp. AZCC_0090]MBB6406610.1 oligopeptide/dipeptide ABC transporter ATP-binding protein [Arthrobacter sp. AZCC_0090]